MNSNIMGTFSESTRRHAGSLEVTGKAKNGETTIDDAAPSACVSLAKSVSGGLAVENSPKLNGIPMRHKYLVSPLTA